jgi:hypothetical protein
MMTPFEQRQFAELVAEIVLKRLRDSPMDGLLDGHQAAQLMNCSRPTVLVHWQVESTAS